MAVFSVTLEDSGCLRLLAKHLDKQIPHFYSYCVKYDIDLSISNSTGM